MEDKNNIGIGTGIAWGLFWIALAYLMTNASKEQLSMWF